MTNDINKNRDQNPLRYLEVKPFLITALFCALYRFLLDNIYIKMISPSWSYAGFTYTHPSTSAYIASWIVVFVASFFCYKLSTIRKLSSVIMQGLIYISFFPGITFYVYKEQSFATIYYLYWLFLLIFFFAFNRREAKPIQFNIDEKILSYLAVFFFVFCFYIWARYARFHIQIDVLDIYGLRESASGFGMSRFGQYMYASVQVCIPFLAVWALEKRKYFIFVISCFAQLFAFFSQGSKTTFFALIVAVLVYLFIGRKGIKYDTDKRNIPIILKGMIFALIGSSMEFLFLKTSYLVDYLCRRILFLPNLLNCYYYDFFSNHEFDYLRSSVLRLFGLNSPYSDVKIPYIIGTQYFNSASMYANNGLFSDAYMNFGIAGILILPILIVLLLKLFDKCMGNATISLQIGATIYVVVCIMGSSFFTNLFSHGFLLLALLFCFLKKDEATIVKIG